MHQLESKRRHFFSLKSWYGHGRTGRTIAAGPDTVYKTLFKKADNPCNTLIFILHAYARFLSKGGVHTINSPILFLAIV